ncbi:hypothetical protein BU15DRAFT_61812 [Melanogaster broomeanus]|nr:hypothetical protein BU15DRAFT_61812 [Melanogaster broomeanus]
MLGVAWPHPVPSAPMPAHNSRPLRSSPLARPGFSTLPSVISESSEGSHEKVAASSSPSGYGTEYSTSGNGSASADGEASTSSISFSASANGTASSQAHGNTQSYRPNPAPLPKSAGTVPTFDPTRGTASTFETPGNKTSTSTQLQPAPPPRARTTAYGHSRSASLPTDSPYPPPQPPAIPQTYSPASSRRTSPTSSSTHVSTRSLNNEGHYSTIKQGPSISRDPASNWLSSSPFGPAVTPKFSRLAMASPSVVMPLSAKEYKKQKVRESYGNKELPLPTNHVSFADEAMSRASRPLPQSSSGSPHKEMQSSTHIEAATSRITHPSSLETPQPRPQPELQRLSRTPSPLSAAVPEPGSRPHSAFIQSRPSSPNKTRSGPTTPCRSQSLSPKSSSNTFFSFASSSSEDEVAFPSKSLNTAAPEPSSASSANGEPDLSALPPARPRPRPRRRKSYPDRRSGDARLSFVDAMNRLSQEGSIHRHSVVSQTNSMNRLSVVSQASGKTLFYEFVQSEQEGIVNAEGEDQPMGEKTHRTSRLHTQSLEDLSSSLARTGIEVVERDIDVQADIDSHRDGDAADMVKSKRNVRMVSISDNVGELPPPGPRRRKLTKSRPPPERDSIPQVQERRLLLPWMSRVKGEVDGRECGEGGLPSLTKERYGSSPGRGASSMIVNGAPPSSLSAVAEDRTSHTGSCSTVNSAPNDLSTPKQDDEPPSTSLHRVRRYTFQFIPSPSFHRATREKSKTVSDSSIPLQAKAKGKQGIASRFRSDSTTTVIQSSENALTLANPSPVPSSFHNPSTVTPSRSSTGKRASGTPVFCPSSDIRYTAKDLDTVTFSRGFGTEGGDSTPSLTTCESMTTTSSRARRTPPLLDRLPTEPFIARPSALKEFFTDSSEDHLEGVNISDARRCTGYRSPNSVMAEKSKEDNVDSEMLHPHLHPYSSSRPGTSSSTATTATSTSYASFSTIPASTSSSSSPSPSPSITKELLPNQNTPQIIEDYIETHPCALCGHPVPAALPDAPTSSLETGSGSEIHPMFAVPLVTVTSSSASQVNLLASTTPWCKQTSTQKRDANMNMGVASGTPPVSSAAAVSVASANTGYPPLPTLTPTPTPTPSSRLKRPRPQTAPLRMGDTALKFAEAIRARDLGTRVGIKVEQRQVEVEGERVVRRCGRESKWRALLKGWMGRA